MSIGIFTMKIDRSCWPTLSAYIFIDLKIDSSSTIFLKSRFFNLCDYLGENDLEFNRSSVNLYLAHKKSKGCKNSYLNNILKVCQYVHSYLLTSYSYDSGCEKLTYFKKERHVYEILTPCEAKSIYSLDYPYIRLREHKNIKFQAIYAVLTLTGMRIGELLNLKWKDVTEHTIIVRETKTDADRLIPSNPIINEMLILLDMQRDQKNPYIFQGEDHQYMDITSIRYDLKKRIDHLKITKRVWLHLFRHSFCVEMLRNNDVTLVAKLMGHESLSSTLSYSHYLIEDMAHAVATHPLLKQEQSYDVIMRRIERFVDQIIDKEKNTVHIKRGKDVFSICVKR